VDDRQKYEAETSLVEALEVIENYESLAISSTIGILKELVYNIDREDMSIPTHSKDYIKEKLDALLGSLKEVEK
jgi:hypothetical protein